MQLNDLNTLNKDEAAKALFACCGSSKFVSLLMQQFPFTDEQKFIEQATTAWYEHCTEQDWREAFTHHPKIGDIKSLEEIFASTKHLAGAEQAGMSTATNDVIQQLAKLNNDYFEKFGFIFIVCATGKSAGEMLSLLEDRINNSYGEELTIAMGEQHKITIIRLKKLLPAANWSWMKNSHITTHVLDTSIGKPGRNISIQLQQMDEINWRTITQGITNDDGRIGDLLPPGRFLTPGIYKITFDTGKYFSRLNLKGFYPKVEIQFSVFDTTHYHVPLLINPYGYSTYRGS